MRTFEGRSGNDILNRGIGVDRIVFGVGEISRQPGHDQQLCRRRETRSTFPRRDVSNGDNIANSVQITETFSSLIVATVSARFRFSGDAPHPEREWRDCDVAEPGSHTDRTRQAALIPAVE